MKLSNQFAISLTLTSFIIVACSPAESPDIVDAATSVDQKVVSTPVEKPATVQVNEDVELSLEDVLKRGRIVWLKCRSCHETDLGRPHKVGPNLHALFGSAAATKGGFSYSEALKTSDIVWSNETLDAFIEKPTEFVPGTKMAFVGISKESDRIALIEYMRDVTKEQN